jgi:hypothetical protein
MRLPRPDTSQLAPIMCQLCFRMNDGIMKVLITGDSCVLTAMVVGYEGYGMWCCVFIHVNMIVSYQVMCVSKCIIQL